jgi:hypothetical protein
MLITSAIGYSPRVSRKRVGKLACLHALSAESADCEARSAEQPVDDMRGNCCRARSVRQEHPVPPANQWFVSFPLHSSQLPARSHQLEIKNAVARYQHIHLDNFFRILALFCRFMNKLTGVLQGPPLHSSGTFPIYAGPEGHGVTLVNMAGRQLNLAVTRNPPSLPEKLSGNRVIRKQKL